MEEVGDVPADRVSKVPGISNLCKNLQSTLFPRERARGTVKTEQLELVNNGARTANLPVSKSDIYLFRNMSLFVCMYMCTNTYFIQRKIF